MKMLSQIFSVLGGISALGMLVVTLWYVFGNLSNPIPNEFLPGFAGLGLMAPIFHWIFGLGAYILAGGFITVLLLAASRITLVGWAGFIEEEKEKSARARKEATREVGTLVAVSIVEDGLLDSATSMIETTDGFYRVFGRVDVAHKGAKVTIRNEARGFFNIQWLCLGRKQYQMTK